MTALLPLFKTEDIDEANTVDLFQHEGSAFSTYGPQDMIMVSLISMQTLTIKNEDARLFITVKGKRG